MTGVRWRTTKLNRDHSGLPWLIEWSLPDSRCHGPVILTSILRRGPGAPELKRAIAKPYVPYGVTAWKLPDGTDWHPICQLPPEWLHVLRREVSVVEDDDNG
jgi:hypothetical protein